MNDITTVTNLSKAQERFEWLVNFLTIRFSFVNRILGLASKRMTRDVETMGVRVLGGHRFELVYNPDFLMSLEDSEATYVLFHEAMHIALHHCTSRSLGNIPCDLAVNELIPEVQDRCEPPKSNGKLFGTYVATFKDLYPTIEEKQSAEWYERFLREQAVPGKEGSPQSGQSGGQPDRDGQPIDDHSGWKEDEIAEEVIRAKIREIDLNGQWGSVSEGLKEIILAAQVRRINWRNIIRRFAGNLIWKNREPTRKRPNRRTGILHPGSKRGTADRLLVAIDDSMSISGHLQSSFLGVINGMLDYMPIDVVMFDADITDGPRPFDRHHNSYTFTGRGGTSFGPVISLVDKRRYRGVIILTDGEADSCSPPKNAHVLWVLPEGKRPPVEWGKRVHLDPNI